MSDEPTKAIDLDLEGLRAWHHEVQGTVPGEVWSADERAEHHAYRAAEPGVLVNLDVPPKTEAGMRGLAARHHRPALAVAMRSLHALDPKQLEEAKKALDAKDDDELFTLRYLHAAVTHAQARPGTLQWREASGSLLKQVHAAALK